MKNVVTISQIEEVMKLLKEWYCKFAKYCILAQYCILAKLYCILAHVLHRAKKKTFSVEPFLLKSTHKMVVDK